MKALKIVRLSNSRGQSNVSSQKESSREKIKIKNLIKLSNLKEKLAFKGNFKIKLRNGSLNSQQSQNGEASQKEEAKTTRSVIKKYVHKIDNEPEGGTRKKIKQKVSLLLNQNLKNTLKSTKRLKKIMQSEDSEAVDDTYSIYTSFFTDQEEDIFKRLPLSKVDSPTESQNIQDEDGLSP